MKMNYWICFGLLLLQRVVAVDGWVYVKDTEWLFSEKNQAWYHLSNTDERVWLVRIGTGQLEALGASSDGGSPADPRDTGRMPSRVTYPVVDTGQVLFYGASSVIDEPDVGGPFYGQDAQYAGRQPSYYDNENGTVSDRVTGLMWTQDPGNKMTLAQAEELASSLRTGGYDDWRLPTIKELYSLIKFNGQDLSGQESLPLGMVPFIDTQFFQFEYGNPADGDRLIDAQFVTSTADVGDSTFGGGSLVFGVNFADGRIKGYPGDVGPRGTEKLFYVLFVRGNPSYGVNQFADNGDGTVSDGATGLMWSQADSGEGLVWEDALAYAESATTAGYDDWRLPNAKELQSIVDYQRSPGSTGSAAIDPVFQSTQVVNEAGQLDYPYFWSSTTHANLINGASACYFSFGRAMGYFGGWQDVHGAGAQRSDPKTGNADDFPQGRGPQGDAIRIYNFVRVVRDQK